MQQHEYAGAPIKDNEVPHSELVKQAAAGDQYAFEALTQRYQGLLLRYINSYLRDYDQAHDVLQQVLLQLYLCLPALTASESLKPWLLQVARHRCEPFKRCHRYYAPWRFCAAPSTCLSRRLDRHCICQRERQKPISSGRRHNFASRSNPIDKEMFICEVDYGFQKREAERVVQRIAGVKGVTNLILVKPQSLLQCC